MTTKLCNYQPDGGGFRCSRCGDTTDNQELKRVCPVLRNRREAKARTWAYGVTTCPERVRNGLLARTLASLSQAGFDKPRLFVDGKIEINEPLEVTYREPKLRTFGNWVLSLWELYVRDPHADLYAIFQDDCVAVRNLREYFNHVEIPENGYLNLYTFPQNEKDIQGFYESNQLGKGAVGIVIPKNGIVPLLASEHMAHRPRDFKRGHRNVDGGIVTAFKKAGWKEHVHNPSLLQHVGDESSMGNRRFEKASTFPGENFDAMSLIANPAKIVKTRDDMRPRICLYGANDDTIIGTMNAQIARYCNHVTCWLYRSRRGWEPHGSWDVPRDMEAAPCDIGNPRKILWMMQRSEIVLFVGSPPYRLLVDLAVQEKKRVVCVPWGIRNEADWMEHVSLFVCPTQETYDLLSLRYPCAAFPWPPDPSSFPFRLRETWRHTIYVVRERDSVGKLPDEDVKLVGLIGTVWPPTPSLAHAMPGVDHARSLYEDGDVLINPSDVVTAMEALSCGVPVLGAPEPLPSLDREYNKGDEIAHASIAAREWAELNRWQGRVPEFEALVRDGTHRMSLPFRPRDSALPTT